MKELKKRLARVEYQLSRVIKTNNLSQAKKYASKRALIKQEIRALYEGGVA